MQYDQNIAPQCKAVMTPREALGIYKTKAKYYELISKKNTLIKLSVVIPLFRAGHIAWLALESLIRQHGIDFEWELIIMEEDFDNPFGFSKIAPYEKRLNKAGCVRILYISISKWVPLSAKWYFLIRNISLKSKVVAFNAADGYCSKNRLQRQYNILSQGKYNWYKLSGNLVYDISLDKHVKRVSIGENRADNASRAASSDLAKQLPLACVKTSVDGWTYNTLNRRGIKSYYDESDLWHDTINVNGINNISLDRKNRILNTIPPLSTCCNSLNNHIPKEIAQRLRETKAHLLDHKTLLANSKIKLKGK